MGQRFFINDVVTKSWIYICWLKFWNDKAMVGAGDVIESKMTTFPNWTPKVSHWHQNYVLHYIYTGVSLVTNIWLVGEKDADTVYNWRCLKCQRQCYYVCKSSPLSLLSKYIYTWIPPTWLGSTMH